MKEKIDWFCFIKTKNFLCIKGDAKEMKRQTTGLAKKIYEHLSDTGLASKIQTEL